jgi:hypothetical protein
MMSRSRGPSTKNSPEAAQVFRAEHLRRLNVADNFTRKGLTVLIG